MPFVGGGACGPAPTGSTWSARSRHSGRPKPRSRCGRSASRGWLSKRETLLVPADTLGGPLNERALIPTGPPNLSNDGWRRVFHYSHDPRRHEPCGSDGRAAPGHFGDLDGPSGCGHLHSVPSLRRLDLVLQPRRSLSPRRSDAITSHRPGRYSQPATGASSPGALFLLLEPFDLGSPEDELGSVPASLDLESTQAAIGDELVQALARDADHLRGD